MKYTVAVEMSGYVEIEVEASTDAEAMRRAEREAQDLSPCEFDEYSCEADCIIDRRRYLYVASVCHTNGERELLALESDKELMESEEIAEEAAASFFPRFIDENVLFQDGRAISPEEYEELTRPEEPLEGQMSFDDLAAA